MSITNRLTHAAAFASFIVAAVLVACAGCRSAARSEPDDARERPPVVQDMNIVTPADGSSGK